MRRKKLPYFLTQTEQTALVAAPNPRYPTGERNRLLIRLMLDTGLRLSEAINLRWVDLDLHIGRLMVRSGKGGVDRTVWVGTEGLASLCRWRERQASLPGTPDPPAFIFTTLAGKRVSGRYVHAMLGRYARKAGIAKHVHPHMLRHTFATDLLRSARNIKVVQRALGHAYLSTTEIYTHLVDQDVEEAMKGFRSSKEEVRE